MTAKVSDYKNVLYERDYSYDLPPETDLTKRVAAIAVPFLSLYSSFTAPISVIMSAFRVWNIDQKDTLATVLAVTALVASVFCYRMGVVITALQDIFVGIKDALKGKNWEEVAKTLFKIFNSIVYLALITVGGLELSIVAFMLQSIINLIQSRDEFNNDRWLEGLANLFLAGIRLHQSYGQYQQLKRNWEIEAALEKIYVGQLHERWRFPSDHLPVGIEVDGVRVISWNVLNNAYMEWVTDKDSQGLNGSMISELDVKVHENGLTQRDVLVADMVQSMMKQGQIVALQECSEPFLEHLQAKLPESWDWVRSFNTKKIDQDVILFDRSQLMYQSKFSETTRSAYPSVPGRPLQNAYFSNRKGNDLRIINAHIPGDPTKPGKEEFARYVWDWRGDGAVTVAVGDYNFQRDEMIAAFRSAGARDFSFHSPWKTNIDPDTKQSKGIDHFFVIGEGHSRDLTPDEVLSGGNLRETIDLLYRS